VGGQGQEKKVNDFERGYNYVMMRCRELAGSTSMEELLELAKVFAEAKGENAELAQGMSACYRDMAQEGSKLKPGE